MTLSAILAYALLSDVVNSVLVGKQLRVQNEIVEFPHSFPVDLWTGEDAEISLLSMYTSHGPGISTLGSVHEPVVQILGMKACGTNLLLDLMKHNLPVRVLDKLDLGYGLFWKHSPMNQIISGRPVNQKYFPSVFAVAVVRNPFSLLKHYYIRTAGKNMCGVEGRLTSEMLDRPCSLHEKAPPWDGGKMYTVTATNVVALWNDYVHNYLDTLPGLGFKNSSVVRFEDLVLRPKLVMTQVATAAGVEVPAVVAVPMKPMGPSVTSRESAVKELQKSKESTGFSSSLVVKICGMLDLNLMRKLQYHECSHISEPVSMIVNSDGTAGNESPHMK
uniref:Sulfotransferase domain-containing protein n=1 Tax=Noctiluca scintillans TaxID=2966 RepID=A0A7S1F112_NOCSC|mmetsp:Transcript_25668/g.67144  ORF Transcript_25668/g.67144 Transcript_25668/m.67144 type:complete len:331 (+) Transcript_25668:81-1073(+)|eukprot:CAMPEP_0194517736 /NCGR_PEP_ID=MMETSP0253-20130528/50986_1 /TAXON_ID=2966 /ORGANISM="Noctiluca scintillans" /LENGTH=330 /DNA_ID=CAMNT_0039361731 /DNA_START=31 /DNA_END=1023 /DNA_ORIENTATION=-